MRGRAHEIGIEPYYMDYMDDQANLPMMPIESLEISALDGPVNPKLLSFSQTTGYTKDGRWFKNLSGASFESCS